MVRTRGLGHALGHVTGRGVGRGDHHDSDDAPQCRQPIASAQRQRVHVTAGHDESVVPAPNVKADVFPNDPMALADVEDTRADIPADTGTQAAEDEHEGFPGCPSDPSVLTQYADHVTCSVWMEEERLELKLSSHGRKVHSLGRLVPAIKGLVAGTELSPLIACSVDTSDRGLLSLFVEWWHRETSSFHLPVGELAIMLDDVSLLLHVPVVGDLHAFQPLHVDDAVQMLVDLLMVSAEAARAETGQCRGPYVCLQWVHDIYERRCQSATNVHVVYLEALRDLSQTGRYAWGVAALCWIYEHFPSVAEPTVNQDYDEDSPHSCRWIVMKKAMKSIRTPAYRERLDRLRIPDGPVVVYYRLERVVRQFGYTQTIPAPPVNSWVSYDDIHDRWMHYSDHMVPAGEVCVVLGQCASDYMDWFFHISHTFMTSGHVSDPLLDVHALQPQVVPQALQTDISHVPEPGAPSTSARPAVEEPRHAVEVCHGIAKRLERHLSLGVVTSGSSTHEVIEECLRMVRSVTQDQVVYVRSRRKRRTDQT
ncbi:protein MAINTENANCE OF MERISTEMS-like [Glycine soja]|uniref:protein MAINTENANCE OF MERISTEMS-like n=1 Tax=Glycine soja TaxID=3848 RepID=UPI00103D0542|nr:protein MAINTENANCE OF MERISTEMS-like [Glycine soja]